jgi:hypothetical protein
VETQNRYAAQHIKSYRHFQIGIDVSLPGLLSPLAFSDLAGEFDMFFDAGEMGFTQLLLR